MGKKTALSLFLIFFLIATPCQAMQVAALRSEQRERPLDEAAAKELVQQLLTKKYVDMVSALSKLTDEQKEFIKDTLHKSHSAFAPQIRLHQVLSDHTAMIKAVAFSNDGRFALTGADDCTARLWDLTASPVTSQKLAGHTDQISSIKATDDIWSLVTHHFWLVTGDAVRSQSPVLCNHLQRSKQSDHHC